MGHFTVYGPTRDSTPNHIYTRRKSVATIAAQKTFLREGDILSQVHVLYSGWAFRFKQLSEGRRQILSFLIPGDLVPLEELCFPGFPLPFSVKSLTALSLCTFDAVDMIEVTRSSEAQSQRTRTAMRDCMVKQNNRLVDLGRRSAVGRLSQFILELETRLRARELSNAGTFLFPIRQEDIADALGLTAVYVNRTLDRLRQDGIIHFDRHRMTILDFDLLKKIAEEE